MELRTTNLTLLYLGGHLRRIMYKDEEILRMIYSALRDDRWFTLPMTIENEHIVQHKNSFHIQYVARYRLNTIDYEALITIDGNENDIITFHFQGKAYSDFLRNRIGICTHHPIKECIGQLMLITHPDGSTSTTSFPRSIHLIQHLKTSKNFHGVQLTRSRLL